MTEQLLDLQVRYDGTPDGISSVACVPTTWEYRAPGSNVFTSGSDVGRLGIERLDFNLDVDANPVASVLVTLALHAASIELIADLADPIPGLATKRIYVLSNGIAAFGTRIHDADTGERMDHCVAIRLALTPEGCQAWVTLLRPSAPGRWQARRADGSWNTVTVVEREVRLVAVDDDEHAGVAEHDLGEFEAWRPVPSAPIP